MPHSQKVLQIVFPPLHNQRFFGAKNHKETVCDNAEQQRNNKKENDDTFILCKSYFRCMFSRNFTAASDYFSDKRFFTFAYSPFPDDDFPLL